MLNEILQDAVSPMSPSDTSIKRIADLASLQLQLQRSLESALFTVTEIETQLREVSEQRLPFAMMEVGVNAFELSDGSKITIKPFYGASITDENRKDCFGWLEENGHAALIKKEVTATPPRDDADSYIALRTFLDKAGLGYKVKEAVHPQTLSAFVKEQVESGAEFPMDLFKVFTGKKAKITEAK